MKVHPYGWNVLSRNVTTDEQSEWTCVHDVQDIVLNKEVLLPEVENSNEESAMLEKSLAENPM